MEKEMIPELVVICVAVIVVLSMVGTIVASSSPPSVPQRIYGSEVLRPVGDVGGEWGTWTPDGCVDHYDCVDDATLDGNTTHLWTVDADDEDQHILGDLSTLDMTIISVRAWTWARVNETPTPGDNLNFGLSYPHGAGYGDCVPIGAAYVTLAWVNYSLEFPSCNVGIPWTPAYLDNITFRHLGVSIASHNVSISSEGVIVEYSRVVMVPQTGTAWDLLAMVPLFVLLLLVMVVVIWWHDEKQ